MSPETSPIHHNATPTKKRVNTHIATLKGMTIYSPESSNNKPEHLDITLKNYKHLPKHCSEIQDDFIASALNLRDPYVVLGSTAPLGDGIKGASVFPIQECVIPIVFSRQKNYKIPNLPLSFKMHDISKIPKAEEGLYQPHLLKRKMLLAPVPRNLASFMTLVPITDPKPPPKPLRIRKKPYIDILITPSLQSSTSTASTLRISIILFRIQTAVLKIQRFLIF